MRSFGWQKHFSRVFFPKTHSLETQIGGQWFGHMNVTYFLIPMETNSDVHMAKVVTTNLGRKCRDGTMKTNEKVGFTRLSFPTSISSDEIWMCVSRVPNKTLSRRAQGGQNTNLPHFSPGLAADMCRGFLLYKFWRILIGIFLEAPSRKNGGEHSGNRIREKLRRLKNKNPQKNPFCRKKVTLTFSANGRFRFWGF